MAVRVVLGFAALLVAAGCGAGGEEAGPASVTAGGETLEVGGVPAEDVELSAEGKPAGPPSGWWPGGTVEFFVDAPAQTVDAPAELTFTLRAATFDEDTRGQVDQLGVFQPGGQMLGTGESLTCPADGRAEPDPCIASAEFLENGDARIVVLTSDPATG